MSERFNIVKEYIYDLGFDISEDNKEEELVVINDESKGIRNLILDCEDSILIIEQFIFRIQKEDKETFKRLLQMNRNVIHGAFVLDDEGKNVLFRDTLQLENLDLNELEGTINSLSLALVEHANELIEFSKLN
jgi:hypothetical protein